MTHARPMPLPVAIGVWIVAEALRTTTLPATTAPLRDVIAAVKAGPRGWPVYAAWGLGCTPRPDIAARQQQADGCGAAALGAVLQTHGRHVRQSLLWSLTRLPGGGTSAARLARVGTCLGLECTVQRLAFDTPCAVPAPCPLPVVVHLRRGHFVVLRKWSPASAVVFDPACGGVGVRPQALQRRTSGYVITCIPRSLGVTRAAFVRSAEVPTMAHAGGVP